MRGKMLLRILYRRIQYFVISYLHSFSPNKSTSFSIEVLTPTPPQLIHFSFLQALSISWLNYWPKSCPTQVDIKTSTYIVTYIKEERKKIGEISYQQNPNIFTANSFNSLSNDCTFVLSSFFFGQ